MASGQKAGLTPLGKAFVGLFIVGLIGGGLLFAFGGVGTIMAILLPGGDEMGDVNLDAAQGVLPDHTKILEADDLAGITTVQEYAYVPMERLPKVKGVSNYAWDEATKTVEFPINMWIGWLPIVAANNGFAPNEESVFFKEHGFKVNLKLIDDPVAARNAYASGQSHVLWGTLDMMVLFTPELLKDSRTAPRIMQQIDWSNGGDGIVVRDSISTVRDLRGKTIVYAQNSPSQYYVNALLINAGIQPNEVTHKFTASAFEAAAAFVADPSIDACASWAPDIYNIPEKVAGTKILSTTADANKLIADVWAMRADFANDHPEIAKGLVEGIFKGMDQVALNPGPAAQWMSEGFGLPLDEINGMMADAHLTNFERTWNSVSFVYRELGLLNSPVRFDQVMDFSAIQAIDEDGTFKNQKDTYTTQFVPQQYTKITAEEPILTQELRINFYPNSCNLKEPGRNEYGAVVDGTLYDPMIDATVGRAGVLAGQFDAAVIAVSGHTDASMKGKVEFEAVRKLSECRAEAVKNAMVEKYKFNANKFVVRGEGWRVPADEADPNNHLKNRRVEIAVYSPESE